MSITQDAELELNQMLDEGVRVTLAEPTSGRWEAQVVLEDAACADCLVPDATLSAIVTDALQRRGAQVSSVQVQHHG